MTPQVRLFRLACGFALKGVRALHHHTHRHERSALAMVTTSSCGHPPQTRGAWCNRRCADMPNLLWTPSSSTLERLWSTAAKRLAECAMEEVTHCTTSHLKENEVASAGHPDSYCPLRIDPPPSWRMSVRAQIWSATNIGELHREAVRKERYARLHPAEPCGRLRGGGRAAETHSIRVTSDSFHHSPGHNVLASPRRDKRDLRSSGTSRIEVVDDAFAPPRGLFGQTGADIDYVD